MLKVASKLRDAYKIRLNFIAVSIHLDSCGNILRVVDLEVVTIVSLLMLIIFYALFSCSSFVKQEICRYKKSTVTTATKLGKTTHFVSSESNVLISI